MGEGRDRQPRNVLHLQERNHSPEDGGLSSRPASHTMRSQLQHWLGLPPGRHFRAGNHMPLFCPRDRGTERR